MMNLKYYLRGLGIGVIVTALIMGIAAGRKKETLSNEEIKQRAAALGMVEESQVLADMPGAENGEDDVSGSASGVLSGSAAAPSPSENTELLPESDDAQQDDDVPEEADDTEDEFDSESNVMAEPSAVPEISGEESAGSEDEAQTPDESGENFTEEVVTIQIESGEGSFIVCQKLEDAGLVPLASEFDRYLYDNGYDKRINIGTYEIPVGAGFEEIAKIIAKLN